jgi:hypothetical protein
MRKKNLTKIWNVWEKKESNRNLETKRFLSKFKKCS